MVQISTSLAQEFGRVLRQRRIEAGVSQEELAYIADVDRTFVSMLERGLRTPGLGVVLLLAQALGTTGADLVLEVEARLAQCDTELLQNYELR